MIDPLRAAWWGWQAAGKARKDSATTGFDVVLDQPPALPDSARRGVSVALRLRRASCLERSLVCQKWDAAHGRRRDLVIGVTPPRRGFAAHAWLDGDDPCHDTAFVELSRRPPT